MSTGDDAAARCWRLAFAVLFWLVFVSTQIGHRQVRIQQSMQEALSQVLRTTASLESSSSSTSSTCTNGNNNNSAANSSSNSSSSAATGRRLLTSVRSRTSGDTTQSLDDIEDTEGILRWLSQSLVPQLWLQGSAGRGVLFYFNRALGGVRITHRGLARGPCPGGSRLNEVYNITCHTEPQSAASAAAELVRTPGIYVDPESGSSTQWLDLASTEETVQSQLDRLWEDSWFSPGTQRVWVQSVFLNAQVSLIAFSEVEFFLDRVGRLSSSTQVSTLPTEVYGDAWLIWTGDVLMLAMVLALLGMEILEYLHVRRQGIPKNAAHWRASRFVNGSLIFLGLGFSIFFGYLARELSVLSGDLSLIPWPGEADLSQPPHTWTTRHRALDEVFKEVGRLSGLLRFCELSTFWYSLLVLVKFFASLEGSPRLAVITATMRHATTDIFHFMIVFLVVFITFAFGAYFLFGHQLEEWAGVLIAVNSSFRALMGDFNFDDMYDIAPLSAMVWFWLFMSLIFLVMLNMLLAIILDTYTEVKENADAEDNSTLWQHADVLKKRLVSSMAEGANSVTTSASLSDGGWLRQHLAPRKDGEAETAQKRDKLECMDMEISSLHQEVTVATPEAQTHAVTRTQVHSQVQRATPLPTPPLRERESSPSPRVQPFHPQPQQQPQQLHASPRSPQPSLQGGLQPQPRLQNQPLHENWPQREPARTRHPRQARSLPASLRPGLGQASGPVQASVRVPQGLRGSPPPAVPTTPPWFSSAAVELAGGHSLPGAGPAGPAGPVGPAGPAPQPQAYWRGR